MLSLEDIIDAQAFATKPSDDSIEVSGEDGTIILTVPGNEAIKLSS